MVKTERLKIETNGHCLYPSRANPYFVSGRLISSALLPFLILYVAGIEWIFSRLKNKIIPLLVIAGICIAVTCSEVLLSMDVFASPYNWFHLK